MMIMSLCHFLSKIEMISFFLLVLDFLKIQKPNIKKDAKRSYKMNKHENT